MSENNLTRRSFIKTFLLGGLGLTVSFLGMKSKKDSKKLIKDNLPKDSIYRPKES